MNDDKANDDEQAKETPGKSSESNLDPSADMAREAENTGNERLENEPADQETGQAFGVVLLCGSIVGGMAFLISVCLLKPAMVAPVFWVVVLFCVGMALATPITFSVYLSFGRAKWWVRWGNVIAVWFAMIVFFFVSMLILTGERIAWQDIREGIAEFLVGNVRRRAAGFGVVRPTAILVFSAPAILGVTLVPMWIGKYVFWWRITLPMDRVAPARLSILDLMGMTALVAIVIASLRSSAWVLEISGSDAFYDTFVLIAYAVLAAVVQWLGLWTFLRFDATGKAWLFAWFPVGLILLPVLIVFAAMGATLVFVFPFLLCVAAGFVAGGYLPIIMLRSYGYRLVAGNAPDSPIDDMIANSNVEAGNDV